jgi:hypothetical protein
MLRMEMDVALCILLLVVDAMSFASIWLKS